MIQLISFLQYNPKEDDLDEVVSDSASDSEMEFPVIIECPIPGKWPVIPYIVIVIFVMQHERTVPLSRLKEIDLLCHTQQGHPKEDLVKVCRLYI